METVYAVTRTRENRPGEGLAGITTWRLSFGLAPSPTPKACRKPEVAHEHARGGSGQRLLSLFAQRQHKFLPPPPPRHRQGAELQIRRLKAQSSQQTCWQAQLSEAPQGSRQVTARGRQAEQLARKPPWDIPGSTSLSSIPGAFPREPSLKIPDKSH